MQQRIITGVCLIILVLSCMFIIPSSIPMFILMLLIAGFAGYEWYQLMPEQAKQRQNARKPAKKTDAILYGVIVAWISALPIIVLMAMGGIAFSVMKFALIASSIFWLVSIYWTLNYPKEYQQWYNKSLYAIGCVLIASAVFSMFFLWRMSAEYLLYVFLLVWGADSGAYFVGRQFGQTQLAPKVSPNKTVEGLVGGIITTLLIMIAIMLCSSIKMDMKYWVVFLIIAMITVLYSVQGDLFESMLKRRADVKDSGTILPGHGGVLDRVDSLLAATPIFLLGLYVLELLGVAI